MMSSFTIPLKYSSQFKNWLAYTFEHPDEGIPNDIEPDDLAGVLGVEYLTELFGNAAELLQPYSNSQVSRGLSYLLGSSEPIFAVIDESLPWELRRRCIQSMYVLYTRFFRLRCSPVVSFKRRNIGPDPVRDLNHMSRTCFSHPYFHRVSYISPHCHQEFLGVMGRLLEIDSNICREGALTGLSEWHFYMPQEVGEIIDQFLDKTLGISDELKEHALRAQTGRVL